MDLSYFQGSEAVVKRRQSLDFCSPQDRSPVLPPWGRANSRSHSKSSIIQVGTDNVVLVEVGSGEESAGPYITRVEGELATIRRRIDLLTRVVQASTTDRQHTFLDKSSQ